MIAFVNKGMIDLRAVKTFGISAKDHANPIGYFGTGLKYAIAVCLRMNAKIYMVVGDTEYKFEKLPAKVRGKDFEIITMNGEELPFTTHLGANWEAWQAFRELYCNAIDEQGSVVKVTEDFKPFPHGTTFLVEGKEFEELYHKRNTIVLQPPRELLINPGNEDIEIYDRPSQHLYYRGIRVFEFQYPAKFTYNIVDKCDLTEDRTLKYEGLVLRKIPTAWGQVSKKSMIRSALLADPEMTYEGQIDFMQLAYEGFKTSNAFDEILNELYEENHDRLNRSAINYIMKKKAKSGAKHYESSELTPVQKQQLERVCSAIGGVYPDFSYYEIKVVRNLGENTMAIADFDRKMMVIAKPCFERGNKFLMSTLIEEFFHLKTGFTDCTRSLQTYLFDQICTIIENHHLREPI